MQSPFTGRYEPVNPEQPVLYARYTKGDDALKVLLHWATGYNFSKHRKTSFTYSLHGGSVDKPTNQTAHGDTLWVCLLMDRLDVI